MNISMKNDFKKLKLEKFTVARITMNELTKIQGGTSILTNTDLDEGALATMNIDNCPGSHAF